MAILLYPLLLIVFWYKDSFLAVLKFFEELNSYIASLISLPSLVKTFFKPLKNEYREGLIVFSVIAGITVKTFIITLDLLIMAAFLIVEISIIIIFLALPILLLYLLFV